MIIIMIIIINFIIYVANVPIVGVYHFDSMKLNKKSH